VSRLQSEIRTALDRERSQKFTWGSSTTASALATANPDPQPEISSIAVKTPTHQPQSRFLPQNEWEGVVEKIDVNDASFSARLDDITNPATPQEYAEFYLDDVSQDDMPLVQIGAVFRWVIGKREDQFGTIERTSKIVFRRLPAYSVADIEKANARAEHLSSGIRGE
jgi:hypothetical protein